MPAGQREADRFWTAAAGKAAKEAIYLAMRLPVYKKGMPIDTVEQRRTAYLGSVGAAFDVESLMRGACSTKKCCATCGSDGTTPGPPPSTVIPNLRKENGCCSTAIS